jgi:hypothetical protein
MAERGWFPTSGAMKLRQMWGTQHWYNFNLLGTC